MQCKYRIDRLKEGNFRFFKVLAGFRKLGQRRAGRLKRNDRAADLDNALSGSIYRV